MKTRVISYNAPFLLTLNFSAVKLFFFQQQLIQKWWQIQILL